VTNIKGSLVEGVCVCLTIFS